MKILRGIAAFLFALLAIAVIVLGTVLLLEKYAPEACTEISDIIDEDVLHRILPSDAGVSVLIPDPVTQDEALYTEELQPLLDKPVTSDSGETEDTVSESMPVTSPDETEAVSSVDETMYPFYAMLDEEERAAYEAIVACLSEEQQVISLTEFGLSESQFSSVWEAVLNDRPELFWITGGCSYALGWDGIVQQVKAEFYTFDEGLADARIRFEAAAAEIIDAACVLETDYDKEIFIHDTLAEMAEYDLENEYNQSAYSTLVTGGTVCAGYARAFQYLMQECGIPCYYCTGTCGGTGHAWNIVKLGEDFYNVDLTWDDASGSRSFFNRTDEEFSSTHRRSGMSADLPACLGGSFSNTSAMPEEAVPSFGGSGHIQDPSAPDGGNRIAANGAEPYRPSGTGGPSGGPGSRH